MAIVELYHPATFMQGTRVLHLRGRHKDGLQEQRSILKISYDESGFKKAYGELISLLQPGERIYAAAGARDMKKATRLFRERQLASEFEGNPFAFYRQLESQWASALMAPTSQHEKLWLFDCDSSEERQWVEIELGQAYDRPKDPYWYETKSGAHAIVQPFDRSRLGPTVRSLIHENPYLLWAYAKA